MTGAADTTLILTKRCGDGGTVLYGRGRDLPEFELALEFGTNVYRWNEFGLPSVAFASDTKRRIIEAMRQGKQSPAAICDVSGVEYKLTKKTLQRMAAADQVMKNGQGFHELLSDPLSLRACRLYPFVPFSIARRDKETAGARFVGAHRVSSAHQVISAI